MGAALAVGVALVVGLLGVLVVGLLRSHAEILKALHDLGVNLEAGAPAALTRRPPNAASHLGRTASGVPRPREEDAALGEGHDLGGELPGGGSAHVAVVGVEHRTLLAFLTTGCGTCAAFWESLSDPEERALPGPDTRILIVAQGGAAESAAAVRDVAPIDVVTVMSSDAWDAYAVPVAPYFVLVDGPSGRVVGEGAGASWRQVVDLLSRSVADQAILDTRPVEPRPRTPKRGNGAERAVAIDEALLAAGIGPGDPSLYPAASDERTEPQ